MAGCKQSHAFQGPEGAWGFSYQAALHRIQKVMAEVPSGRMKGNVTASSNKSRKEDTVSYRPVSLTSVTGKIMRQVLEAVLKHI